MNVSDFPLVEKKEERKRTLIEWTFERGQLLKSKSVCRIIYYKA